MINYNDLELLKQSRDFLPEQYRGVVNKVINHITPALVNDKLCPECGSEVYTWDIFCWKCGKALTHFCQK